MLQCNSTSKTKKIAAYLRMIKIIALHRNESVFQLCVCVCVFDQELARGQRRRGAGERPSSGC